MSKRIPNPTIDEAQIERGFNAFEESDAYNANTGAPDIYRQGFLDGVRYQQSRKDAWLKMAVIVPILLTLMACTATKRPPVVVPPVPIVSILTVQVEPPEAIVSVNGRQWSTRPNGTIVEEFRIGETLTVTASAPGYVTSAPQVVTAEQLMFLKVVLERVPAPPTPVLTVKGRQFYTDAGALWVPRMVSGLTLLTRTAEQQSAFLDWAAKTGFNGVRVFAGALTWAGQTPDGARGALPGLLDRAAERGLVVEVTAITDSATGYDAREHVRLLAGLLTNRRGVLFELANEVGHPSQSREITEPRLREWGAELVQPLGLVWAVGASSVDEPCPGFKEILPDDQEVDITKDKWESLPDNRRNHRPEVCLPYGDGVYPAYGGSYNTAHLERTGNRKTWNVWRRVREIFAITENHRSPSINNEPEGCAEPGTAGQRYYDPAFAFTAGVLDRAFGVGGVHHSQSGLFSQVPLPGKTEQACAEAYVAGHAAIDEVLPGAVGVYKNKGHDGSPIANARLIERDSEDGAWRAYSFISGNRGVTILVGLRGDPGIEWGAAWRQVRTVASRTAQDGRSVVVLEITR
jgi:hypothetical protein